MKVFHEFAAILMLIVMYVFKAEVEGGDGSGKKEKVITDVMGYLTSPEGFYISSTPVLQVIRFVLSAFLIDLLVALAKSQGFLGFSTKPSS